MRIRTPDHFLKSRIPSRHFLDKKNETILLHSETMDEKQLENALGELYIPFTFNAKNSVSLKLYPDNRPKNLEIADLQKGLVLTLNGAELIEEGAGFGVPIVKYYDHTFFCGSAKLYVKKDNDYVIFKKIFFLDSISKKGMRGANINDKLYSVFHDYFERAYLSEKKLRVVLDGFMRLRKILGVQTKFTKDQSRGKVTVIYHCFPNHIKVCVDLSELEKTNCQEILILNEQGASYFQTYSDTNGTMLHGRQIEAWKRVEANQASFSSARLGVSFSLENVKGATLYRGREQIKDRFSWAGMAYALNTNISNFNYKVKLSRVPKPNFNEKMSVP